MIQAPNNSNLLQLKSKFPQYTTLKLKTRYNIFQLISSCVIGFFLLCLLVIIISLYLLNTPTLTLASTSQIRDPNLAFDLSSLPRIQYHFIANIRISHSNIIPLPVHLSYDATFEDQKSNTRVGYGEVANQVLLPRRNLHTQITANLDIDLFESNFYSLTRVLDNCGMFGGGRTPVFVSIYGKIGLGYSFISIPVKEPTYHQLEFPCPMPEENLGQIVLGLINKMIPKEEQYNNTINNNILKRHLDYIAY